MREDNRIEFGLPAKSLEVSKVGVVVVQFLLESFFDFDIVGDGEVNKNDMFIACCWGKEGIGGVSASWFLRGNCCAIDFGKD